MSARRVLIVDDDAVFRRQLGLSIQREFLQPLEASDSASALAALAAEPVAVAFVDLRLGQESGIDLVASIRRFSTGTEVVAVTGFGSLDTAIRSLRAGAIDFIEKPIEKQALDTALGRALERHANNQQIAFSPTVLLVDDEKEILCLMKTALARANVKVLTAESAAEGMVHLAGGKVDVVVADVRLPDLDGIELLKRARALYEDIEAIVITGYQDNASVVQALRAGALDYLIKPIDLEILAHAVSRAIERVMLTRNVRFRYRELRLHAEIHERVKAQQDEELAARTAKLQQTQAQLFQTAKLATLGEMAAGVAHELNQPLAGIALAVKHLHKLRERGVLGAMELDDALGDIDTCVARVTAVVDHVRTFARQETKPFVQVDINACVDGALKLIGEQLRLAGIELVKDLVPNVPKVVGEPFQIEQVILNLLTNARDACASSAAGPDSPRSSLGFIRRIELKTRAMRGAGGQPGIALTCRDTGRGMGPEVVARLFEPFFTSKPPGAGTGLGLAISKSIVQMHGGEIRVASEPGRGSTFTVWLSENGADGPPQD